MLTKNSYFKYGIPNNGPFGITQCWTNTIVTLQCGAIKIRRIKCCIKPYTYYTSVEDIISEN